ncbi:MAG: RluA family pseudouridine synthase [Clostridiales bacterium]|nr:RluA family pseudouridine synthase [Clostridiales bacterium]
MRPVSFTVPRGAAPMTVKHILTEIFFMSHSHVSRLKRREGGILLNGAPCYVTARCAPGDTVTAEISDPPDTKRLEGMETPLDVVYEDEWLIVVNKPAGLTVHPERAGGGGSLENALTAHFKEDEFVHTVSRLDRGTSGLLTAAKSGYMHECMIRILHTKHFYKEYLAVVWGSLNEKSGSIELPLAHPEGSNYRMEVRPDGHPCLTEYETVLEFGETSLVRLVPRTGRMHQLRVHMAAVGHPIVGDWLYGEEVPFIDHPALHSSRLVFTHPMTGERIELSAPLPGEIERLIGKK